MHTITVIGGGLALLGLFSLLGVATQLGFGRAMLLFMPVWLVGAALNMWVGVTRAGYTVAQEFPIFLVVFAVPVIVALALRRWLARQETGNGS